MNNSYEVHQIKTFFLKWINYSYIVLDKATNSAIVIDPAWELDKITNKLCELNSNLVAIFLTHSHYDHVNIVDPLIKMYNPIVYMAKEEIDYYKFECINLKPLYDKETIRIGETYILCILTPGHTMGGMCYLLKNSLFTGDTIFIEGCGICFGDGGSEEQMFSSIQKVKSMVPKDVKVFPGHSYGKSPGQTIECLMRENIYFQIDTKEIFVNFRRRKNQKHIFNFK